MDRAHCSHRRIYTPASSIPPFPRLPSKVRRQQFCPVPLLFLGLRRVICCSAVCCVTLKRKRNISPIEEERKQNTKYKIQQKGKKGSEGKRDKKRKKRWWFHKHHKSNPSKPTTQLLERHMYMYGLTASPLRRLCTHPHRERRSLSSHVTRSYTPPAARFHHLLRSANTMASSTYCHFLPRLPPHPIMRAHTLKRTPPQPEKPIETDNQHIPATC